ncbi:hypothetical protein [Spirochaeta africana]|uniref:Uncharacterized protein n=1 Tax=Spirochaeta africana (strain ATCC 700263 / DSM 8902 / Z-7692) TaxID=889378 RepID=H9UGW8_SPIAZ|nr:hypothetical protein [Spirochaeta africana]AFG36761.1 hypothetical protein Spiaf_0661 [Spirochaeta africana DSM 8902]
MHSLDFWQFTAELIVYGLAVFLAIMVWGRTRDVPWLFMVIGVISLYAGSILDALHVLGAVNLDPITYAGASPVRILVQVFPGIAFAIGFLSYIRGRI